ncbi:MAG: GerW family sporulation protein [Firmicutes bacterium]|nr:GerW family sporulation protein [Bacillota bacterium]
MAHTGSHPIEFANIASMESIKGMIDVNTVVGEAVQTPDGGTIIPISRVSFGFAAGGGEYWSRVSDSPGHPFGGGSGAGVTVHPVGFLVAHGDNIRLLSVERGDLVDSIVNNASQIIDQIQGWVGHRQESHADTATIVDPHSLS